MYFHGLFSFEKSRFRTKNILVTLVPPLHRHQFLNLSFLSVSLSFDSFMLALFSSVLRLVLGSRLLYMKTE